jgi:hypothetical protein
MPTTAVAGFFEDLLPRLQDLRYTGLWPRNLQDEKAAPLCAPLLLPHLRNLALLGTYSSHPPPWTWFVGARPLTLCADGAMLPRWLPPEGAASCRLLAAVRTLEITAFSPTLFFPAYVAQLSRAAPHLAILIVSASGANINSSWLGHPAFDELVHLTLQRIRLRGFRFPNAPSSDTLLRMRQRHFPRLKELAIDGCEYFTAS